jgi:hypothetical protein
MVTSPTDVDAGLKGIIAGGLGSTHKEVSARGERFLANPLAQCDAPAHRNWVARTDTIMFHEIQTEFRYELATGTSVSLFEHSLSWLRREGWKIVSLEECLERVLENDRSHRYAVLTFDDGYRGNVSMAFPIRERPPARTLQWLGLRYATDALSRLTDPDLRRRLGEGGKALHRTRPDIYVCAERLVAIWTESVHAGEP